MAVEVLKERGVPEDRILFLNLISSPEGTERFSAKFPKLHVITAFIDQVSSVQTRKLVVHLGSGADTANRDSTKRSP